jgi:hypothetical protein
MCVPFDQLRVRDDFSGFALINFSYRSASFWAQSLSDSYRHLWPEVNPAFFLVRLRRHCASIVLANLLMLLLAVFGLLSLLNVPCTKCIIPTRAYQSVSPSVRPSTHTHTHTHTHTRASVAQEPLDKFWLIMGLEVRINYCKSIQYKSSWLHGAESFLRT